MTTHSPASVRAVMLHVLLALLPAIALHALLVSPRLVLQLAIALATALLLEALVLRLRKRPLAPALGDGSALVAATLLTLSVTPLLPPWQLIVGIAFTILLGKHVFGGLGSNPFNPAMVGYAVLLVSFPADMTRWPASAANIDGITSATPRDALRSDGPVSEGAYWLSERVLASDWLAINVAIAFGGLYLLWRGVIRWHIPAGMLAVLSLCYLLEDLLTPDTPLPLHLELLSGAIMLGAFFIATDPVTAPSGRPGRLLYGAGIGLLCFVIRQWSVYPDGVAFAVLLMNITVPAIDRYLPDVAGALRARPPR